MMSYRAFLSHIILSLMLCGSAFSVSFPGQVRVNTDAWTHFTVNNGLPDESIRQVAEDYDGSLIVVTANNGLFRYDGIRFLPLAINQQLPSLFIQKVISDSQKRLWIACNYAGIWILDRGKLYPFSQNHLFRKQHFTEIYCDSKGRIWVNVNRVGLFVIQGDKCENFSEKYNLPIVDINQIGEDQSGNIFFILNEISFYQFTFDKNQPLKQLRVANSDVKRFLFAADSVLWIIGSQSVGVKMPGKAFNNILGTVSVEIKAANNILADSYGRIWFSIEDYIYCIEDEKISSYFFDNIGNSNVFEDRFGNLWFSSNNGIYKFINQYPKVYDFPHVEHIKNSFAIPPHNHFLYRDNDNRLWFTDNHLRLYFFDGKKVNRFALPESLETAKITAICQDKTGIFWFGTYGNGVFNWNGNEFFRTIPQEKLPGKYITSIFADTRNRVWIGSISALHHFSSYRTPENNYAYSSQAKKLSGQNTITSLTVDSSGIVWLGTAENFLFRSSGNVFRRMNSLDAIRSYLWNVQNLCVTGGVVQGNSLKMLFNYDRQKEKIDFFHPVSLPQKLLNLPPENNYKWYAGDFFFQTQALKKYPPFQIFYQQQHLPVYNISALVIEKNGGRWIASYSVGLFYSHGDTLIRFDSSKNLPSLKISALCQDNSGTLWVGTLDQGIFKIKNKIVSQPGSLWKAAKTISAFFEDRDGNLWAATMDNGLLLIKRNQVSVFRNGLAEPEIYAIGQGKSGKIYVCLDSSFASLTTDGFTPLPMKSILTNSDLRGAFRNRTINFRRYFSDAKQTISSGIICWDHGKIKNYTAENGLPGHEITDITETADGKIWAATFNTGLAYFDKERFIPVVNTPLDQLTSFTALCPTPDSALWILTEDEGLGYVKNDSVKIWRANSRIITVHGRYLQSTPGGEAIVSTADRFYYLEKDGSLEKIPTVLVDKNRQKVMHYFSVASDGNLWFTTSDGKLIQCNLPNDPPIVRITHCQIGNRIYQDSSLVNIINGSHKDRTCVIEFFGYHSSFPGHSLSYSYRVIKDGEPENWSPFSRQQRIIYSDLSPGKKQRIEIRAKAPNGRISEIPAAITVNLAPKPLYLHSAFLWGLALLSLILIVMYLLSSNYRIKRLLTEGRFNPYVAGEPIFDNELFFGRDQIVTHILNILHNNSIMITGERRIGKTSLLIQIKQRLQDSDDPNFTFLPVFIDLQGVNQWDFFPSLINDILEQHESLFQSLPLRVRSKTKDYSYRDFSADFRQIIRHLKTKFSNTVKVVLLIDEADAMNEYDQVIHAQLRRIFMQDFSTNFSAIIAGTNYIKNWNRPESPWWNLFTQVELKSFDPEDAKKLIKKPVKGIFKFTDEAINKILDFSENKPYLIQLLCIRLINNALERKKRKITEREVEFAISRVVESIKV